MTLFNTSFEREVGLSSHQRGQCTKLGQSSPTAQQSPHEYGTRKLRRTSPRVHVKLEPRRICFCSETKNRSPRVFLTINSLSSSKSSSSGLDDKELRPFLQAMNRQRKTDKSFFRNSNCLSVPTVSAEDHINNLFHDSGKESDLMQGSFVGMPNLRFRLVMNMILYCGCLGRFPQPMTHIHQRPPLVRELVTPRQKQTIRSFCTSP